MIRNERGLPYLDQDLITILFACAFGVGGAQTDDQEQQDFVDLLSTLRHYNMRYRRDQCQTLGHLFPSESGNAYGISKKLPWLALALAIRDLYGMRLSTLKGLLDALPPQRSEDDIVIAWALRFDGYAYREAHPFDEAAAFDHFYRTGEWNISLLQRMTLLFLEQRFLYKWGGEQLPRYSSKWRAFRILFLDTYDGDVPETYRYSPYYETWESQFQPYAAIYSAQIRWIHETTTYNDSC